MLDSLFTSFERIVVLDTETTGIDCKKDEIIELAAASVTPAGVESEMDVFIRLSEGRTLPPMITQLTGITPQQLEQEGVEKWEAAAQFAAAISHPNTLLVAYNAQFDLCFLYYFLARLELADALKGVKMLDAMTVYKDRREYPHKLQSAIDAYGVPTQNTHRAVDDAKAALEVLEAMGRELDDLMQYVNLFGYNPNTASPARASRRSHISRRGASPARSSISRKTGAPVSAPPTGA